MSLHCFIIFSHKSHYKLNVDKFPQGIYPYNTPHEASQSGHGGGIAAALVHHIEIKVVEVELVLVTD